MREDLIERLRAEADLIHDNGITRKLPRHRVAALLREAAAAIEAAREDSERWRFVRDSTACSLSLTHNDHRVVYQSVADTLDDPQGYYNNLPDGERERMIAQDSIWTLHIYPNTPVGFNVYHGATLAAAIDQARGKGVAE